MFDGGFAAGVAGAGVLEALVGAGFGAMFVFVVGLFAGGVTGVARGGGVPAGAVVLAVVATVFASGTAAAGTSFEIAPSIHI